MKHKLKAKQCWHFLLKKNLRPTQRTLPTVWAAKNQNKSFWLVIEEPQSNLLQYFFAGYFHECLQKPPLQERSEQKSSSLPVAESRAPRLFLSKEFVAFPLLSCAFGREKMWQWYFSQHSAFISLKGIKQIPYNNVLMHRDCTHLE